MTNPDTDHYRNVLLALVTLGLPLTDIPQKVWTSVGLQCALQRLKVSLLEIQIEVMKAQLEADPTKTPSL